MKLKFFSIIILSAMTAILLSSCGGGTKKSDSQYVGKTYSHPREIGLYYGTGVMLTNDMSLNIMSTDPDDHSNKNIHIYLASHSNSVVTILSEMEIDRDSPDRYVYHEYNYTENGELRFGTGLLLLDSSDGSIKEVYLIDLKKLKFIPTPPYENIELEDLGF